jgi:hypothetical protein
VCKTESGSCLSPPSEIVACATASTLNLTIISIRPPTSWFLTPQTSLLSTPSHENSRINVISFQTLISLAALEDSDSPNAQLSVEYLGGATLA